MVANWVLTWQKIPVDVGWPIGIESVKIFTAGEFLNNIDSFQKDITAGPDGISLDRICKIDIDVLTRVYPFLG